MIKYDLIVRDCLVVDPLNAVNKVTSVGVAQGKIVETGDGLDGRVARQVAAFPGMVLTPGMIDTHMHCSAWLGGELAFGMLSRAGVTTALDMAGPTTSVLHAVKKRGSGINVAILEAVRPEFSVKDLNPSYDECASLLQKALTEGAIGLKLTGGHYPLTPEATANAIRAATDGRSYIAFHAGSAKNGSNINGFMDALEFAGGRPFHMAHVNAYCRGMVIKDSKEEMKLAIRTLKENRQIISEFHPAPLNGTSGKCRDNQPESHVTRNCLRMGGYAETEEGLRQALKEGYARVSWENLDGENRYVQGMKALEYWINMKGACTCCFPVNDRESAFLCASAVDEDGVPVIDALSSDGGGIPRNFMIQYGYQLVDWGLWSIEDYVRMTSVNPARMLGLESKGHLSCGADADITIFDPKERRSLLTMVKGRIVCLNNVLLADEGTIICTEKGYSSVKSAGLNSQVVNLEKSMLYLGRQTFSR